MSPIIQVAGQWDAEHETLGRYDGVERVPWLPLAHMVAVAPAAPAEDGYGQDPVYAWIEWSPGVVERPLPGSTIWRAVLAYYLDKPPDGDPTVPAIRAAVRSDLDRFPDIESWLHWADHERLVRSSLRLSRANRPTSWAIGAAWPW